MVEPDNPGMLCRKLGDSTLAMCTHFPPNYFMTSILADVATLLAMLFSFKRQIYVHIQESPFYLWLEYELMR